MPIPIIALSASGLNGAGVYGAYPWLGDPCCALTLDAEPGGVPLAPPPPRLLPVKGLTPPPLGCALAGELAYPLPLLLPLPPKGVCCVVPMGEAKLERRMSVRRWTRRRQGEGR
jgi:hypothetical protein